MNSLISELIAGIEKGDDEAILGACEVADTFHVRNFQPIAPYDERLRAEPPTAEYVEAPKRALIVYLQSTPTPSPRVYAALGKLRDPSIVPLLREHLARDLKTLLHYAGGLSALIIALDNSGEKIIINSFQGHMEVDNSIEAARQYLKQFGQVFPW